MLTRADVGGSCPSTTQGEYNNGCSCGAQCTWASCRWENPPAECLKGTSGEWKWNKELGLYQAVVQTTGNTFGHGCYG